MQAFTPNGPECQSTQYLSTWSMQQSNDSTASFLLDGLSLAFLDQ